MHFKNTPKPYLFSKASNKYLCIRSISKSNILSQPNIKGLKHSFERKSKKKRENDENNKMKKNVSPVC